MLTTAMSWVGFLFTTICCIVLLYLFCCFIYEAFTKDRTSKQEQEIKTLAGQLHTALKKNEQAERLLSRWMDKQGHNRCWYYPDIFNQLIKVYDLKPISEPCLPPREEFEKGCVRYQVEQFGPVEVNKDGSSPI